MEQIGKVSGNRRLDPKLLKEPDIETEQIKTMWFDMLENDPDFLNDINEEFEGRLKIITQHIDASKLHYYYVGKSHLDLAYKWRYEQSIQKSLITFAKAVFHCEKFPNNFQFCFSTPQVFDWIKENDPALFKKIQHYVKIGQIEIVGGLWVEPDGMLPSGEAIIRQRLYGMKFYLENFGFLPTVESLPDSFGFNVGMPQLLKKSGADCFFSHKMTWNQTNVFPFMNFWWRSPDGSKVLVSNFPGEKNLLREWPKFEPYRYYLKEGVPKTWNYESDYHNFFDNLDTKHPISEILIFDGKGDGGHGPTHQEVAEMQGMILVAKNHNIRADWAKTSEYFESIGHQGTNMAIWADELFLEDHQGTFSIHPEVKRNNRRFETLIPAIERFATIIKIFEKSYDYPYQTFEKLWKQLALLQFHDVLPGSSIPEVFDDTWDYWVEMQTTLDSTIQSILSYLQINNPNTIVLFNQLNWKRHDRFFIPYTAVKNPPPLNKEGKPPNAVLIYKVGDKEFVQICQPIAKEPEDLLLNHPAGWWTICDIDGFGIQFARLEFESNIVNTAWSTIDVPFQAMAGTSFHISNQITTLELDQTNGSIVSFVSVDVNHGNNLVAGSINNLAIGFEDGNPRYPAWNLKLEYWNYPLNYDQTQNVKIAVTDVGPIFQTVKITRTIKKCEVMQTIQLFKDDPAVYCIWASDWREINTMLKIGLETTTHASYSTSDQMYCSLRRSTTPVSILDVERYEKVMHDYVDLSSPKNEWGITVLNEGKYSYDTKGGEVKITLHRSAEYPDPASESWANLERLERKQSDGSAPPQYVGIGPISCRYAYFPHQNGALLTTKDEPHPIAKIKAEEFNNPIVVGYSPHSCEVKTKPTIDWVNLALYFVGPKNIEIVSLKMSEWSPKNSMILRIHEICGIKVDNFSISLPDVIQDKIENIIEVDLIERPIETHFKWDKKSKNFYLSLQPNELKTVEIIFEH